MNQHLYVKEDRMLKRKQSHGRNCIDSHNVWSKATIQEGLLGLGVDSNGERHHDLCSYDHSIKKSLVFEYLNMIHINIPWNMNYQLSSKYKWKWYSSHLLCLSCSRRCDE